ncbi:MAG: alpha/beta fold hydrolase [Candidatus Nanopelagicales bacterium]
MAVPRRSIRWLLAGALAIVLVLVAAYLVPRLGADDGVVRSSGATATARALNWQPCDDAADQQCAFLPVPKSWDNPGGGTFRLHMRRLPAQPATPGDAKLGSLIINTGGPDIASSGYEMEHTYGVLRELRAKFDLVWPDPRGTGKSEPQLQRCSQDPLLDRQQPAAGPFSWPQATAFRINQQTPSAAECLRLNPVDGKLIGTREVVRDVDAIRQALGEDKITYLGYSYGTRLGTQYAKTFPARVRAMVLDGTVDPSGTVLGLGQTMSAGDPLTAQLVRGSLSPQMQTVYDDVVRYLQTAIIKQRNIFDGTTIDNTRWTFGWNLGYWAAGTPSAKLADGVQADVCELARAAGLPSTPCPVESDEVATPTPPQELADLTAAADASGPVNLSPARWLINCADLSGRPDADAIASLMPAADQPETPLPASFLMVYAAMCSGYPDAWAPIGPMTPVADGPTPLFVNGTTDPATPLGGARAMQRYFPGARMVTLPTAQHGIFPGAKSACVNAAVTSYLISGTSPAADLDCPTATP